MTVGKYDFIIEQGATFRKTFRWQQSNGCPTAVQLKLTSPNTGKMRLIQGRLFVCVHNAGRSQTTTRSEHRSCRMLGRAAPLAWRREWADSPRCEAARPSPQEDLDELAEPEHR